MIDKALAEFVGTFILVFFGAAVLMGDRIGFHGIAMGFGLAIVAAACGFGTIWGADVNPAVPFGLPVAGRLRFGAIVIYVLAQCAGAIAAAGIVSMIATGAPGHDLVQSGLGQNGRGAGYNGDYDLMAALAFEFVATLIFVQVILGATQSDAPAGFGGQAMQQLWLFIVVPMAAGGFAGILHGSGLTRTGFAHPTGAEKPPRGRDRPVLAAPCRSGLFHAQACMPK